MGHLFGVLIPFIGFKMVAPPSLFDKMPPPSIYLKLINVQTCPKWYSPSLCLSLKQYFAPFRLVLGLAV